MKMNLAKDFINAHMKLKRLARKKRKKNMDANPATGVRVGRCLIQNDEYLMF